MPCHIIVKYILFLLLIILTGCNQSSSTELNPADSLSYSGILTSKRIDNGNSATAQITFHILQIIDSVTGDLEVIGNPGWATTGYLNGHLIDSAGAITSDCEVSGTNKGLQEMHLTFFHHSDSLHVSYTIGFVTFYAGCSRM